MDLTIYIIIAYFLGLLSGVIYNGIKYREKIKFYEKRNEKLSLQRETETDDKKVLERKIATLEIALQNALKNQK